MPSIIAENKAGSFQLAPAGNHVAICYQMIEIGTVQESFNGETKWAKKVRIGWELSDELMDDGRPFMISKEYTMSMHEKSTLRKHLTSWRGKSFSEEEAKAFDITALLGKPCLLQVIHKPGITDPSRIYSVVDNVTTLPKGTKKPVQSNKSQLLAYNGFDAGLFATMPEYIQTRMKATDEYKALNSDPVQVVDDGSDLPF